MMLSSHALWWTLAFTLPTPPPIDDPDPQRVVVQRAVLARYADLAYETYARCAAHAHAVREAIVELTASPSAETLRAAREAWLAARDVYGRTEVFRFYNGPIDDPATGVETFLNAWPLDEAYIDYVDGYPEAGIINDVEGFPNLDETLLVLLNERGGEANVSIGWHAIEFLLWGQDHDVDGPGARPFTDYVDSARHAERRARYLRACADLLVEHHEKVLAAWAPERENYRAEFLAAEPSESLRKVLAGMTILCGFEMAGERLAVAYETQDQEEEHSCFSDNTHVDFRANQEGILLVYHGGLDEPAGPGVRDLARLVDPLLAAELDERVEVARAAIAAIPVPFDRAIRGSDDDPGRRAVLNALVALERQAEALSLLASACGHEIALQPGG